MSSLLLIPLCLGLGALLRRTRALPEGSHRTLNAIIVTVSLPAFTLLHLHRVSLGPNALFPVLMAWILFLLGAALLMTIGKLRHWDRRQIGALVLTGALANTSFVGFPMLEALFGTEALGTGILTDQPGSFLVLSTLGVAFASFFSTQSFSFKPALGRILSFPPFYAMIAALSLSPFEYPDALTELLERLASTLVPLALLSAGYQLLIDKERLRAFTPKLFWGLSYKLIVGPALIAFLYLCLFGGSGPVVHVSIIQAAMPPMIMGAVLATEYDLEPSLANLMIGIGIPASLLTVPAWFWILQRL